MYRFGEKRNLKFMLPTDDLRLGWPAAFPGEYVHETNVTDDVYDIVAHHAVLNHATMVRHSFFDFKSCVTNASSLLSSLFFKILILKS
jgi:hypothetical protein